MNFTVRVIIDLTPSVVIIHCSVFVQVSLDEQIHSTVGKKILRNHRALSRPEAPRNYSKLPSVSNRASSVVSPNESHQYLGWELWQLSFIAEQGASLKAFALSRPNFPCHQAAMINEALIFNKTHCLISSSNSTRRLVFWNSCCTLVLENFPFVPLLYQG